MSPEDANALGCRNADLWEALPAEMVKGGQRPGGVLAPMSVKPDPPVPDSVMNVSVTKRREPLLKIAVDVRDVVGETGDDGLFADVERIEDQAVLVKVAELLGQPLAKRTRILA